MTEKDECLTFWTAYFIMSGSTCTNKTKNNENYCDKFTGTTCKDRTDEARVIV